jgi:hypothetical protein
MKKNKNTIIYFIIPVWNNNDRLKLNYIVDYNNIKEIDELYLSKYLINHHISNVEFYNGITKKYVYLKDKVHTFIFSNIK